MENYFTLYALPEQLAPDKTAIRKKYLELSRAYHPDRFATADAATQEAALKQASAINEAYKTLMDDDAVLAYLLKLKGAIAGDEKYALPQDFLMEMMDLNEVVTEYEMAPDGTHKRIAYDTLKAELEKWQAAALPLMRQYDAGDTDATLLARIKDYYYRRKYLLRIQERLDTFAV